MLDIKAWLEGTGEPVARTCFLPDDAPPLPYICYLDNTSAGGEDLANNAFKRSITVERYSDSSEYGELLEKLLNDANVKFHREQIWIAKEAMFETIYNFDIYERV